MTLTDELTEVNLVSLARINASTAQGLVKSIEILKSLLYIQADLFRDLKPTDFGFDERRFPYYPYFLFTKIRLFSNGLMTQLSQGNHISASIILRSVLENLSVLLFLSKTEDREIKTDNLVAADCRNNLITLITDEDFNKISSSKYIDRILADPPHKAALEFQLKTLWYTYNRSYESLGTKKPPKIEKLISLFLRDKKLIENIKKEPFGNTEKIIDQAKYLFKDHPLIIVLDYSTFRMTSRDAHYAFQSESSIFNAPGHEIKIGGDHTMSESFLNYLCFYHHLANDAIILSLPRHINTDSYEARQYEMLKRIGRYILGIRIKR